MNEQGQKKFHADPDLLVLGLKKEGAVPKEPVEIEIVQEGDERFILKTFADGSDERVPIVKLPRKRRYPDRPYRKWTFDKSKKKGF